ncbi:hypothetical protein M422DRAFT_140144, partial [Sphaerobolus stellatus SS14]
IAVLHLCYKTSYFNKYEWPANWCDTALSLLKKEQTTSYKLNATNPIVPLTRKGPEAFDDIDNLNVDFKGDELEKYLSAPPNSHCDPIIHGMVPQAGGINYLHSDYMESSDAALRVTSVDVEWAFSRGQLTVSHLCHSLGGQATCAATILGNWAKFPDLIPEVDIIQNFKDKSKRAGK